MAFVPNVSGVPPLSSFQLGPVALVLADAVGGIEGLGSGPQWGIFLDGAPVLDYDSFVSFDYKQDYVISTYPVENGGFQSYDKVQLPFDVRVKVSAGGSIANRAAFLASIDAVIGDTNLYDVVTPEITYTSVNFTHRDVHRAAANGLGLLVVDLWMEEVRETGSTAFQNTQQPGEAGQVGGGNVQPVTPTQTQLNAMSNLMNPG